MTRAQRIYLGILLAGLGARLFAFALEFGGYHPDAIFQYLEPAHRHARGFGSTTWEWREGARNWLLPALHGAWLSLLDTFGLYDGRVFQNLARLQTLFWSMLLIPAGLRIGWLLGRPRTGSRSSGSRLFGQATGWLEPGVGEGLGAALGCALLPPLVYYSYHTLSEIPAMTASAWAAVFWLSSAGRRGSDRRNGFWLGLLLATAVVIRPATGVLAVVPAIDLLLRRRLRAIFFSLLGAAIPIALLVAVDWLSWGQPLHSLLEWYRYNFIEGQGEQHGVLPQNTYLVWIRNQFQVGIYLVIPLLILALPRFWPIIFAAVVPLVVLSMVGHKEDRFLLPGVWSFMAMALGAGSVILTRLVLRAWQRLSRLVETLGDRRWRARRRGVIGLIFGLWLVPACVGLIEEPGHHTKLFFFEIPGDAGSLKWGALEAQDFVAEQPVVTGVLNDGGLHLFNTYTLMDRNVPMDIFERRLAANPLFDWVNLRFDNLDTLRWLESRGFERVTEIDGVLVLHRPHPPLRAFAETAMLSAGGEGGEGEVWTCPEGTWLQAMDIRLGQPLTVIGGARPHCVRLVGRGPMEEVGPWFGSIHWRAYSQLACAPGEVVVGIHGRQGGFIDRLGLVCRSVHATTEGRAGDVRAALEPGAPAPPDNPEPSEQPPALTRVPAIGGTGGERFESICPEHMAVARIEAHGGGVVDALRLTCAPLPASESLDEARAEH